MVVPTAVDLVDLSVASKAELKDYQLAGMMVALKDAHWAVEMAAQLVEQSVALTAVVMASSQVAL